MKNLPLPDPPAARSMPSWIINMLGFGLLISMVLAVFFFQMRGINQSLTRNALDRSSKVATIIEQNLANAELALNTVDRLVTSFLRDKAEFIAYLDSIDPLRTEEVTALARETRLLGITLIRPDGSRTGGPPQWESNSLSCRDADGALRYRDTDILLGLDFSEESDSLACVFTGLDGAGIAELRNKSSLPVLLQSLSSLPGILSVQLKETGQQDKDGRVELVIENGQAVARSTYPTRLGTLVVSIEANQFISRRNQLRRQFFLFSLVLLVVGLSFSFLLYRFQQKNLKQARQFEKILAREHEAATLGRTTATIAHEIRNPLNAINMGLQRLRLESDNLKPEQENLINAMGEAVKRTSGIVSELQRFTRQLQPAREPLRLDELLDDILTLYGPQFSARGITVNRQIEPVTLAGDRDLLGELMENLVKNVVEALPEGGWLRISLVREKKQARLSLTNNGLDLSAEQAARIGEPYFTSKTRGTGLGLALCKRIARAHGGELVIQPDLEKQEITVLTILPLSL